MSQCKLHYIVIILLTPVVSLSSLRTFQSVAQPRTAMSNESFTVVLEATTRTGRGYVEWENSLPYLGICLPQGWSIPSDEVTCTGAYEAAIRYDAGLSLDQEAVSPAPAGYVWWVGRGDVEDEGEGPIFIEIRIQTDEQVGRFSLDYMWGNSRDGVNQQRSTGHEIEVLADARTPGGLQAMVEGEAVHLSWGAPHDSEGLVGYIIYRDGEVVNQYFVAETSYVEAAPLGGLYTYTVAAFYHNGEVHSAAPIECYVFLRAGGSGTAQDPFQIATARQLIELARHRDLMDHHFRLVSDIDLDPNLPGRKVFAGAVIVPDLSDVQAGFQGSLFTGVFDGNGHAISNLAIEGNSYLGLFGALGPEGHVVDVRVVNVDVTGNGWNVGAIAGANGGTVQDCYSSGLVMGYSDVGGLVGSNDGAHIVNSDADTDVVGVEYVGGLVGSQLISFLDEGAVRSSSATGSVFGWRWVGGLVGLNQGTVSKCSSSSFISGSSFLGGLIGYNDITGSVSNSYSCGTVRGEDTLGGLVGGNMGSIHFTYSVGEVIGMSHVGGLVGESDGQAEVVASFWDMEASGQSSSDGGMGLPTAELLDVNIYLEAGWDFAAESENGTEDVWYLAEDGYAQLFSFGGVGTYGDPYRVDTAWHLVSIGLDPNMLDKHFRLSRHIDLDPNQLGSRVFTSAVIAPDVDPANEEYDGIPFSGTFDGCGYEIRHLNIVGSGYLGLFGSLGPNAHISNVHLVMAHIEGSEQNAQGILAGSNEGSVTNCHTSGSIDGSRFGTGGLIGTNYGEVRYCSNSADVHGEYGVGGLVGANHQGTVSDCHSTGAVTGEQTDVGGLVGENNGSVVRSFCTGAVAGEHQALAGGLVGRNLGHVDKSYSTGPVAGGSHIGGLVGLNAYGTISECYSIGPVTADEYVGGLVGRNYSSVIHSFWDVEASGQGSSDGGLGLTTAQMQDVDTYLNAGWDFFGHEVNGHEDIWIMDLYPIHYPVWIPGEGTQESPYLISNDNARVVLRNIREFSWEHYRLTEDVDLAAIQFSGPVFPHFSGTFDGAGHAICNLTLSGYHDLGLFGIVESNAVIMDLAVVEADVQGTGDQIGILAGVNEGHIIRCSSTGSVLAGPLKHIGGLVGRNYGDIAQCFSDCTISGEGLAVGGLVGRNDGTISDCYCGGIVEGAQKMGGFVGFNIVSVANSYSTAHLASGGSRARGFAGDDEGQILNCFWDVETSGKSASNAGVGLTTTEMQTASTFVDAGWDFVGETDNGTDDIWWILEGQDYPRLWWESDEVEEDAES